MKMVRIEEVRVRKNGAEYMEANYGIDENIADITGVMRREGKTVIWTGGDDEYITVMCYIIKV